MYKGSEGVTNTLKRGKSVELLVDVMSDEKF